MKKFIRSIKWLTFGLEIPFLSLFGLYSSKIFSLEKSDFILKSIIMILGSLIGMTFGVYLLFYVARRQYLKEINN